MATDPMNPFSLPGFHQSIGATQGNPLANSLEMMRTAMQSFGTTAALAGDTMSQHMTPEEIERRIAELKTVHNWLQLNMTMLTSSIQAMEVQLATIRTLRSFLSGSVSDGESGRSSNEPSPLEVVLGLKPAPERTGKDAQDKSTKEKPTTDKGEQGPDEAFSSEAYAAAQDMSAQAAKTWWNMLENQFVQLVNATVQATQMAQAAQAEVVEAVEAAQTKAAPKAAPKPASKTAAKKTSAKKAAAPKKTTSVKAAKASTKTGSAAKKSSGTDSKK